MPIMFRRNAQVPPLFVPALLTLASVDYPSDKVWAFITNDWQQAKDIAENFGILAAAKAGDIEKAARLLLDVRLGLVALSNAGLLEVAEYKPPVAEAS